ncbi:hypothetical protein JJB98_28855 [Bradyrhizobium diazoefficiens]|nr:hypothetical protein [Bradyrhizobium diazoefficiens]QQO23643.1 hypothetical protein JJB98_28855 [Bradyrhizobium diazoefficiens]
MTPAAKMRDDEPLKNRQSAFEPTLKSNEATRLDDLFLSLMRHSTIGKIDSVDGAHPDNKWRESLQGFRLEMELILMSSSHNKRHASEVVIADAICSQLSPFSTLASAGYGNEGDA